MGNNGTNRTNGSDRSDGSGPAPHLEGSHSTPPRISPWYQATRSQVGRNRIRGPSLSRLQDEMTHWPPSRAFSHPQSYSHLNPHPYSHPLSHAHSHSIPFYGSPSVAAGGHGPGIVSVFSPPSITSRGHTPYPPSRTTTPAYSLTSSSSGSQNSRSSKRSKVSWKAPWGSEAEGIPVGPSHSSHSRSRSRDIDRHIERERSIERDIERDIESTLGPGSIRDRDGKEALRHQSAPWKSTPPMAYYNYYQQQAPGWGTGQYELLPPPVPTYNPAPSWGGYDYYRAHAGDNDRGFFDSVWDRFKSAIGIATQGYSRQVAKQLYRRIYGGMTDLLEENPEDLGAAAGYEAIRLWEHHHNLYQTPLNHDLDREREALAGLAIAEAYKLWLRANPYRNRHGRRVCAEVATATAERIFTFQYDQGAGALAYLPPEQQYAASSVTRGAMLTSPYGDPMAGGSIPVPVAPRSRANSFSGRRSRRNSMGYYDSQPPPVSAIPLGGIQGPGPGLYQNSQGYTIASAPGIPYPAQEVVVPSPRYRQGPLPVEPYDDYVMTTGAPGSYGGGLGGPGSYGGGMGPPGSYGGMGVGGGYVSPGPATVAYPGAYPGPNTGFGYEGALAPPGAAGYRRQRTYSQGAYLPGY